MARSIGSVVGISLSPNSPISDPTIYHSGQYPADYPSTIGRIIGPLSPNSRTIFSPAFGSLFRPKIGGSHAPPGFARTCHARITHVPHGNTGPNHDKISGLNAHVSRTSHALTRSQIMTKSVQITRESCDTCTYRAPRTRFKRDPCANHARTSGNHAQKQQTTTT